MNDMFCACGSYNTHPLMREFCMEVPHYQLEILEIAY